MGANETAVEQGDLSPEEWTLREEELRQFVGDGVEGVASLVRSTLGPSGLTKLVETENPQGEPELVLSADAGAILDAVERAGGFEHPVAAMLVDSVDSMQRALSDGTTTALVLTDALVDEGHALLDQGLRPTQVVVGYAMAAVRTGEILDQLSRPVSGEDSGESDLKQVAATSMNRELEAETRDEYAAMVASAVRTLAETTTDADRFTTDRVKVVETGETPALYDGVVVRRWPRGVETAERSKREFDWTLSIPAPITDATVALLDDEIDFESTATNLGGGSGAGVKLSDRAAAETYRSELQAHRAKVAAQTRRLGVDVLASQPRVDPETRRAFSDAGIAVVDGVETPKSDVHRLATAADATVVSHVEDLTPERLGTVGRVVERRVGDEKWTIFDECAGGVVTLVLAAKTERERARHARLVEDALDVTAVAALDGQLLPGAGSTPMAVASELRSYARSIEGGEQLAVGAFADALETVPATLARNAGLDPLDAVTALRRAHGRREARAGIGLDLTTGEPFDAWDEGVVEPRRVFSQAVETARANAEHFLTLDAVLFPNVEFDSFTPQTERE